MSDTNNMDINQRLELLETAVAGHRLMLESVKNSVIPTMDQLAAISVVLSLVLDQLDSSSIQHIENTVSSMTKKFEDREFADRVQKVFEKNLGLKI